MDGYKLLNRNEVLAALKVSERTLRRLIAEGRFPPEIPGKGWLGREVKGYLNIQARALPGAKLDLEREDDRGGDGP